MPTFNFDPNDGKIWVNVKMGGVQFIDYHLMYYPEKRMSIEKLIDEWGDNISKHDDFYQLHNPFSDDEPVAHNDGRGLIVDVIIKGVTEGRASVHLEFFQGKSKSVARLIETFSKGPYDVNEDDQITPTFYIKMASK